MLEGGVIPKPTALPINSFTPLSACADNEPLAKLLVCTLARNSFPTPAEALKGAEWSHGCLRHKL